MPQQYRKKPVVITAHLWSGQASDLPAAYSFLGADLEGTELRDGRLHLLIRTMERGAEPDVIPPGWQLIEGVKGEHYACEPEIFAATYEEV